MNTCASLVALALTLLGITSVHAGEFKNLSYGSDPDQRIDVYAPDKATNAPVIFMVHGGGWRRGDKSMGNVVVNKTKRWVPQGFVIISVNYRMLPDADPLVQADDVARALAKAQTDAKQWGADPGKFILMGHSAGAHLVSLLNAQPDRALKLGAQPWLGTISLDSAGYDIVKRMKERHPRLYDNAFGTDEEFWRKSSPLHMQVSNAKPLLAVCSTKRPDDPCAQAYAYAAKATSMMSRVEVLKQPLSHGQINSQLGLANDYTIAVETFMASLDPSVKQALSSQH